MTHSGSRQLNDTLLEEAAGWLARLSAVDVTAADRADFQEWIAASELHREAFSGVQTLSGEIDALSGAVREQPELMSDALAAAVVECGELLEDNHRSDRRGWLWRGLAAAAVLLLMIAGLGVPLLMRSHDSRTAANMPNGTIAVSYETLIGEQQTVFLDDGTILTLNTDTAVSVRMTSSVRRLQLLRGEAYFDVAEDKDRPFMVSVGGGTVRAVGTAFNIRYRDDQVHVTVLDGEIDVDPGPRIVQGLDVQADPRPSSPLPLQSRLGIGEQISYSAEEIEVATLASDALYQVTSWRTGKLIFDAKPVRDIVAEVQPYISDRIVIADEEAALLKASGVFDIENAESVISAIAVGLPVRIVREPGVIVLTLEDTTND